MQAPSSSDHPKSSPAGRLLPWLCAIGFLCVLFVNALSASLPLNGRTPGEISDSFPNLFVPAGLTFSIWGLIYIALAVFTVRQFQSRSNTARTGWLFILSCVANVAWIFLWHYGQVAGSLISMLVLLGSLIALDRAQDPNRHVTHDRSTTWLSVVPIRIYLGWISVATIANATALLVDVGWNGFGISATAWTLVVVAVACLLGVARLLLQRDIAYASVVLWAFLGILIKHVDFFNGEYRGIIGGVVLGILILLSGIANIAVSALRAPQRKGTTK
jgi:hypothetical protein